MNLFIPKDLSIDPITVAPSHPVYSNSFINNDWTAPFLYADTNNVFYVATDQGWPLISAVDSYGVATQVGRASRSIPSLVLKSDVLSAKPKSQSNPITVLDNVGSTDRAPMTRFISEDAHIARALGSTGAVRYGGRTFGPSGEIMD